jgi:hypothetical protein
MSSNAAAGRGALTSRPADPPKPRVRPRARRAVRTPVHVASIHPKAGAAILAGAVITAIFAILDQLTGFEPEPAVASSLTTVVAFALMWFVPQDYWSRSGALSGDDSTG